MGRSKAGLPGRWEALTPSCGKGGELQGLRNEGATWGSVGVQTLNCLGLPVPLPSHPQRAMGRVPERREQQGPEALRLGPRFSCLHGLMLAKGNKTQSGPPALMTGHQTRSRGGTCRGSDQGGKPTARRPRPEGGRHRTASAARQPGEHVSHRPRPASPAQACSPPRHLSQAHTVAVAA